MSASRCTRFEKARLPLLHDGHSLRVDSNQVSGPVGVLNPTRAVFHHEDVAPKQGGDVDVGKRTDVNRSSPSDSSDHVGDEDSSSAAKPQGRNDRVLQFQWRSRDNRKGRHRLLVNGSANSGSSDVQIPNSTRRPAHVLSVTWRMLVRYPVWDVSWLVAYIFVWGSIVWVINGFFSFLPLVDPGSEFPGESLYAGGITAFIGAIVFFEVGSILLMVEAVNENRSGCFGWAVEQVLVGELSDDDEQDRRQGHPRLKLVPDRTKCQHHHQNRGNLVGKSRTVEGQKEHDMQEWIWFPSWLELRTHYLREIGFLACLAQLYGATVFGISGFTALPGIQNHLTNQSVLNGVFWIPQVAGGVGFIVSGILFMLETQQRWYKPAFGVLGWHIGFWNLVGAVGFTLCGALGMAYGSSGAQFESSLATFWGSFAFLIGSVLQLYESLEKYPVEKYSG